MLHWKTRRLPFSLLALALAAATVPEPAAGGGWSFGDGIKGSGHMETRAFNPGEFRRIVLGGALDLTIRSGEVQSVAVTLDDNLFENLVLEADRSTLLIDWKKGCRPGQSSRIDIVVPRLDEVRVDGAGDVRIEEFKGERFRFQVDGSGDLSMSGQVGQLDIRINGSGDVDARECEARNVTIDISGAGDAVVTARESLDARVDGAGDIVYHGNPARVKTKVGGAGEIRKG